MTDLHTQGPTAITGWFVAPTYGISGGTGAYTAGIRGGIYLDRRFGIAVVANMFGDDRTRFSSNDGVYNMGSYSGVLLQYVAQSNRLVHATFETTVGAGRWCDVINDAHNGCSGKTFVAIEPGANALRFVVSSGDPLRGAPTEKLRLVSRENIRPSPSEIRHRRVSARACGAGVHARVDQSSTPPRPTAIDRARLGADRAAYGLPGWGVAQ
jgi:hypothetical protein